MRCYNCKKTCIRKGFQKNGRRKYVCKSCGKHQQRTYQYKACFHETDSQITSHLKHGCGMRDISSLLGISRNTVKKRILKIAENVERPVYIPMGAEYEMDELRTYLGQKKRKIWIAYALCRKTRQIIDYRIGSRSNRTLRPIVTSLLLSQPKTIYTDGLINYSLLIPPLIHKKRKYYINHIERKNLNLRTHLKRLARKTICYSKSLLMLSACLKIYFWG